MSNDSRFLSSEPQPADNNSYAQHVMRASMAEEAERAARKRRKFAIEEEDEKKDKDPLPQSGQTPEYPNGFERISYMRDGEVIVDTRKPGGFAADATDWVGRAEKSIRESDISDDLKDQKIGALKEVEEAYRSGAFDAMDMHLIGNGYEEGVREGKGFLRLGQRVEGVLAGKAAGPNRRLLNFESPLSNKLKALGREEGPSSFLNAEQNVIARAANDPHSPLNPATKWIDDFAGKLAANPHLDPAQFGVQREALEGLKKGFRDGSLSARDMHGLRDACTREDQGWEFNAMRNRLDSLNDGKNGSLTALSQKMSAAHDASSVQGMRNLMGQQPGKAIQAPSSVPGNAPAMPSAGLNRGAAPAISTPPVSLARPVAPKM